MKKKKIQANMEIDAEIKINFCSKDKEVFQEEGFDRSFVFFNIIIMLLNIVGKCRLGNLNIRVL